MLGGAMPPDTSLRFLTYLAPSLPEEMFAVVARRVGAALGVPVSLACETALSGPARDAPDPFSTGQADVGFLCSPSVLWLRGRTPRPVVLADAAPVFADPRGGGLPVYYSDVIVPRRSPARALGDLAGGVWSYNDSCSLSGYYNLLRALGRLDGRSGARFFRRVVRAGSHLASIRLVAAGMVDGAAIDSNVLDLALARDPDLRERVRVVESWGPYPVQPVVVRAALPAPLRAALTAALLALADDVAARAELAPFRLRGFVPVDESVYEAEREEIVAHLWRDPAELADEAA
jgi:phosphonate transport system substrate-binding protein